MTKKKLWLVPLMGLALGGCTYVQGLMDPSINVNGDFTAYYYLGHHDFDERPTAEKELLPFTSDNTVEGFFNGGGTSLQGDGALSFDPSQPTRGNPGGVHALSEDESLPIHLGLKDAGYDDMLAYGGTSLSTTLAGSWILTAEGQDLSPYIGHDFGKTKCLSTVDEAFSLGYLSKLYNGQMYCYGTHSLAFVSIDEDGFSTKLPKTLVESDYFLVAFRGGSNDDSNGGDTTPRLVQLDLLVDFYYEDGTSASFRLKDTYVNTDNGGEAVSFTGFKLDGIRQKGLIGYGLSFENYRDPLSEKESISARASDDSDYHFGLLLYEVMFVDSTWR